MHALVRGALIAAGLVLGTQAVSYAQLPDSILTIRHDNQTLLRLNTDAGFVVRETPGNAAIIGG